MSASATPPGRSRAATLAAVLVVLAIAVAVLLVPGTPVGHALAGLACLALVLAPRLHRQLRRGQVRDLAGFLATHGPALAGAAVTTTAALIASMAPAAWSLPAAVGLGVVAAVGTSLWLLG